MLLLTYIPHYLPAVKLFTGASRLIVSFANQCKHAVIMQYQFTYQIYEALCLKLPADVLVCHAGFYCVRLQSGSL